ncbi:hypothetical protein DOE76_09925 [Leifsonia sp. ku-ls]|nr:hypothetical protein DOE76_09925 [Leifsonia sp. ku-ls]
MNERTNRSGRRRLAAAVPTGTLLVLLLSACADAGSEVRVEREEVGELMGRLHCEKTQRLEADMAFHDEMRGANCFIGDETVLLRVYEHDSSVSHVLPDLAPTISTDNQIVVGANWYATGSPRKLAELARFVGAEPPVHRLALSSPSPLDPRDEALGLCSSYVTSVVRAVVFEPSTVPALTKDSEDAYPGLVGVAQAVGQRLRDERTTESEFDSEVTLQAGTIRSYCNDIYGGQR